MDSVSPGLRPRRGQRHCRGLGGAPGLAGAEGEPGQQQHRPGSPVGAFGSLQRGGGGFQLFRRESRGGAAAGYARLQEIGDVRLRCQRHRLVGDLLSFRLRTCLKRWLQTTTQVKLEGWFQI